MPPGPPHRDYVIDSFNARTSQCDGFLREQIAGDLARGGRAAGVAAPSRVTASRSSPSRGCWFRPRQNWPSPRRSRDTIDTLGQADAGADARLRSLSRPQIRTRSAREDYYWLYVASSPAPADAFPGSEEEGAAPAWCRRPRRRRRNRGPSPTRSSRGSRGTRA